MAPLAAGTATMPRSVVRGGCRPLIQSRRGQIEIKPPALTCSKDLYRESDSHHQLKPQVLNR